MSRTISKYLFPAFLVLFTIANVYLITIEKPFAMALPLALVLIWAVVQQLDKLLLFIALLTPFSMNLEGLEEFGGIGFYLPTEPILAGIMLVFLIWSLGSYKFDMRIWAHPFSRVVLFSILWILITALTSSLPVVSFKFLASRLWFVIPLYFIVTKLFQDTRYLEKYFWLYIVSLCGVIIITLIKHSAFGFDQQTGHYVMNPYYKDHTSYGAVIAMFYPFVLGTLFRRGLSSTARVGVGLVFLILTVGLVFSYTRAAWLSLVLALGVFIIMKLRIKFWLVFGIVATLIAGYVSFQDDIIRELERNRQDSSENFTEHIQSMTNISSDASNLERLNRWSSAWRMFEERPFLGWGPGTYMFQYAPFQKYSETTVISTNFGDAGNAHSEYLGPLCESGLIGALSFILILIVILHTGVRLYFRLEDERLKMLTMAMLLGLITYFTHGILNNFLDTDKVSVPFWGFCAGIIAIDIYQKNRTLSSAKSS
ncbi:MAG: O-antigen ligase family protein [Flavobacteriales bacterium]|nr:O-antigen ligase family protein [Flavobacteriales bacterium]